MSNPMYASGQPDKRRAQRFTDQHGRRWSGVIEIKSGLPSGPISPLDFGPPLEIPQEHIKYDALEPNNIVIDYAGWIVALEAAKRNWERKLTATAQKMYGAEAGKIMKAPTPELLSAIGPLPKPVEPVQAAASGNRWVLGLTPIKPRWAEKFFPTVPVRSASLRDETGRLGSVDEHAEEWAAAYPDEPVPAGRK